MILAQTPVSPSARLAGEGPTPHLVIKHTEHGHPPPLHDPPLFPHFLPDTPLSHDEYRLLLIRVMESVNIRAAERIRACGRFQPRQPNGWRGAPVCGRTKYCRRCRHAYRRRVRRKAEAQLREGHWQLVTLQLPSGPWDHDALLALRLLRATWTRFWGSYARWVRRRLPSFATAGVRAYELPWSELGDRWNAHAHLLLRVPEEVLHEPPWGFRWSSAVSRTARAEGYQATTHHRSADARPVQEDDGDDVLDYVLKGDLTESRERRAVPPEVMHEYIWAMQSFRGPMAQPLGALRRRRSA